MHIEVNLPLRTASLNVALGEHWTKRLSRSKKQREAALFSLAAIRRGGMPLPVRVTLTRVSAGVLDSDNLLGALKHVRDGVADWLDVDDADARIDWVYAQDKGKRGTHLVRVRVEHVDAYQPASKLASV